MPRGTRRGGTTAASVTKEQRPNGEVSHALGAMNPLPNWLFMSRIPKWTPRLFKLSGHKNSESCTFAFLRRQGFCSRQICSQSGFNRNICSPKIRSSGALPRWVHAEIPPALHGVTPTCIQTGPSLAPPCGHSRRRRACCCRDPAKHGSSAPSGAPGGGAGGQPRPGWRFAPSRPSPEVCLGPRAALAQKGGEGGLGWGRHPSAHAARPHGNGIKSSNGPCVASNSHVSP